VHNLFRPKICEIALRGGALVWQPSINMQARRGSWAWSVPSAVTGDSGGEDIVKLGSKKDPDSGTGAKGWKEEGAVIAAKSGADTALL
jgi:hypothetical protein